MKCISGIWEQTIELNRYICIIWKCPKQMNNTSNWDRKGLYMLYQLKLRLSERDVKTVLGQYFHNKKIKICWKISNKVQNLILSKQLALPLYFVHCWRLIFALYMSYMSFCFLCLWVLIDVYSYVIYQCEYEWNSST